MDAFVYFDLKSLGYSLFVVRKNILEAVKKVKNQIEGVVVDVGCGEMPYKNFLCETGKIEKYIGIDIPPTEYHNTIKPDLYWDGNTLPLPDNTADWVIITEFLEHFFDTQKF